MLGKGTDLCCAMGTPRHASTVELCQHHLRPLQKHLSHNGYGVIPCAGSPRLDAPRASDERSVPPISVSITCKEALSVKQGILVETDHGRKSVTARMDDSHASPISESEVLEESVASAAASGSSAPEIIRIPECETTAAKSLTATGRDVENAPQEVDADVMIFQGTRLRMRTIPKVKPGTTQSLRSGQNGAQEDIKSFRAAGVLVNSAIMHAECRSPFERRLLELDR